jgi:hypothetical protein
MKTSSEPITILTKEYDGGSNEKSLKDGSSQNHFDAFMYFSSQEIRKNVLLGRREDSLSPSPIPKNESSMSDRISFPARRRETRVSFELHPSLLLMDLMHDEFLQEVKTILLQ